MKRYLNFRSGFLVGVSLGVGFLLTGAPQLSFSPLVSQAHAQQKTPAKPSAVDDAQRTARTGSENLADQAHVMSDVGYHFANLWFAVEKQNWPLANYYLAETRSHLKWAVRLHPVRQTKSGDVDLKGILDAVDNSFLTEVGKAIENKDSASFTNAYRQTLVGCYSCHTACEKGFLRPQVPSAPNVTILNFDPAATWPE